MKITRLRFGGCLSEWGLGIEDEGELESRSSTFGLDESRSNTRSSTFGLDESTFESQTIPQSPAHDPQLR
ncbi:MULTISPECIES: hypothetical protein [unclassified Nostoc]|uniref:hypothetical protein n=1 Tax=unclassified Nostoc TaxID=2593658 RepID=UPI001D701287|nr:hypothetical protein [Nostoc sp. JL23]MBN3879538.1 hypothetical protein [Nostoc sp. JL23]